MNEGVDKLKVTYSLNIYKDDEILDLISVVTKLLKESEFYGIQGMSRDEKEVIESLKVLTIQAKTCK
jgi:hypothetical protein